MIEKIMRHWGPWQPATLHPPSGDAWGHDPNDASKSLLASSNEPREVTFADIDTFWATF
jgi:hypothetical protein